MGDELNNKPNSTVRNIIQSMVVAFVITYGLHYIAFFLRAEYYSVLDSAQLSEGMAHVLMYAGHVYFLIFMGIYALTVKGDRKYLFCAFKGTKNLKWLLLGALMGFVLMAICILAANLHGDISIKPGRPQQLGLMALGLLMVFIQASTEELESRAFLFGKMRGEGVPVAAAVGVSAFFFAYLHRANPGFGFVPLLSIFCVGILYALSYYFFGNIWFTCGAHTLWNFTQDFVFGLPDSGKPAAVSIMDTTVNGSSFFYDKDFGIEGSYMAICMNLLACVVVLIIGLCLKKKRQKAEQLTDKD